MKKNNIQLIVSFFCLFFETSAQQYFFPYKNHFSYSSIQLKTLSSEIFPYSKSEMSIFGFGTNQNQLILAKYNPENGYRSLIPNHLTEAFKALSSPDQSSAYKTYYLKDSLTNSSVTITTTIEGLQSNNNSAGKVTYELFGSIDESIHFSVRQSEILQNSKASPFSKSQYFINAKQASADETSGYLVSNYKNSYFFLGKVPWDIGFGESGKLILNGSQVTPFTSIGLSLSIGPIRYHALHGSILASELKKVIGDTLNTVPISYSFGDKYLVNHRFELSLFDDFMLHYNEAIIYGNRSLDLNYLNPFAFLRAQEHESHDRDNVLITLGFKWRLPKYHIMTYHDILLDEWKISKVFSNWFGNKHGMLNGVTWANNNVQLWFEHVAIRPFTYTHKNAINRYTHDGQNLGYFAGPNSQTFFTKAAYFPNLLWRIFGSFRYTTRGLNLPKSESTSWNVGGNIYEAHVNQNGGDVSSITETVSFLGGQTQVEKELILKLIYDHNHHIGGEIQFITNSLNGNIFNMFFRIQY